MNEARRKLNMHFHNLTEKDMRRGNETTEFIDERFRNSNKIDRFSL